MRLSVIEKKARDLGIKNSWRYSKEELIKTIQQKEGNFACFGTNNGNCAQLLCCWREDCLR